jgi:hypothetical protein
MDNLNTHKFASLYEAFPPEEARRIIEKLEIHYTPKHGSWLNMAEIELSVLHRQCLQARMPDRPTLIEKVGAWESRRNRKVGAILTTQRCIGVLQLKMLALNCTNCIRQ